MLVVCVGLMSSVDMGRKTNFFYDVNKMSFVYLLESTDGSTYVGATVDVNRRLRQHNKEITGGARRTGMKVSNGQVWKRICYVSGFPDWRSALQFEWRWKQISRKIKNPTNPLEKRMHALHQLLALEKSTEAAIPFQQWLTPPIIHFTNPQENLLSIV